MSFQFLCPQGHLLEGDEAHMGMQCECPQCGTAFIIPTIGPAAASASAGYPPAHAPVIELEPIPAADELGGYADAPASDALDNAFDGGPRSEHPASLDMQESILHIPCPNGHELETPLEMIGQRAMCPHCGVEFKLSREKSFEYQRQQEILDRRRGRFWFQMAVIAAGFVVVVLLAMIVMTAMR